MHFNGKSGSLPSREEWVKYLKSDEGEKFEATVSVLKDNGIEADGYYGMFWRKDAPATGIYYDNFCFMYSSKTRNDIHTADRGIRLQISFN